MEHEPSVPIRDPRGSYDDLKSLPTLGWAWEFIRRNPKLNAEWAGAKAVWEEARWDGLRMVGIASDPTAPSPLLWHSAANEDAASATVAWNPKLSARVLRAVAIPPRLSYGGTVLDLESLSVEKTLIADADGDQTLILRQGTKSLQLGITGESLNKPVVLFVDTKIPKRKPERQLQLLAAFRDLRATGELLDEYYPPYARANRNVQVLKALDGHQAGWSHREIALCLFNPDRVERDWGDPRENMRDAVRRAIARGLALMEHGFLEFLR